MSEPFEVVPSKNGVGHFAAHTRCDLSLFSQTTCINLKEYLTHSVSLPLQFPALLFLATSLSPFNYLQQAPSIMFRRLDTNLPKDPFYAADPKELGIKVNEQGQFIDANREKDEIAGDSFTTLYHTDNERANEVRREAVHACARAKVATELTALGMTTLHVSEEEMTASKPDGGFPHVEVLTSQNAGMKNRVVLIVGEHSQDLGVWAWRWLMREGGMDGGSAVGLVKNMQDVYGGTVRGGIRGVVSCLGGPVPCKDRKINWHITGIHENDNVGISGTKDDLQAASENACPGLIIFNPGQLNYSPSLNTSMSHSTWLARPKPNALSNPVAISETHNIVPGHRSPEEHVATMFQNFLPLLLGNDTQLYIVGISDGSENVLKAVETISKAGGENADYLLKNLVAMCLIQPTHNPHQIESKALREFLATRAISYVLDHHPMGFKLGDENGPVSSSVAPSKMSSASPRVEHQSAFPTVGINTTNRPESNSGSYTGKGEGGATNEDIHPTDDENTTPAPDYDHIDDELNVLTNGQLSLDPTPSIDNPAENNSSEESINGSTSSSTDSEEHRIFAEDEGDEDIEEMPDAYANVEFSCRTFSSGVGDFTEMIWPAVQRDVLLWFKEMGEVASGECI
ncbi:hypothetical protein MBLNU230_g6941t1 [Neophaeotheca triangularis]